MVKKVTCSRMFLPASGTTFSFIIVSCIASCMLEFRYGFIIVCDMPVISGHCKIDGIIHISSLIIAITH